MFWEDAKRCIDALIGEVDGVGSTQKKTGWMSQGWHRRLTWLRWLKELRTYLENQHTMALASHRLEETLREQRDAAEAEIVRLRAEALAVAAEMRSHIESLRLSTGCPDLTPKQCAWADRLAALAPARQDGPTP